VIFLDLSSIFSESVNLRLAEKGITRITLISSRSTLPAFHRWSSDAAVMPGSVGDVKYFSSVVEEFNLESYTIVTDREFLSMDNMKEMSISFVQPLRRNSKLIDYSMSMNRKFIYHFRSIRWGKKEVDDGTYLYLFEDMKLRGEEHSNLIEMAVTGMGVDIDKNMLGKISVLSSMSEDGGKIYRLYKQREEIEQAFDVMKDELENDKSYLSDDYALRGYFISFVSLCLYYAALNPLRKNGLVGDISVNELLFELSRVSCKVFKWQRQNQ
jgi:transposase